MIDLDELGNRAVAHPPRAPSDPAELRARAERRKRNGRFRNRVAAMVLVVGASGAALLFDRPDQQPMAASDTPEADVGDVFGQQMGRGQAIWPATGLSTETLMETVANEMLHWPSARWDDPLLPEGGLTTHDPDHGERRLVLNLQPSNSGWVVGYTYPSLQPILDDGNLIGLAGVDFGPDTVAVELYRSDPVRQYRSRFTTLKGWDQVIRLPTPTPPAEAGSFLAIGRDATAVAGRAFAFPDRLTVAIDHLLARSVPAELPTMAQQMLTEDRALAQRDPTYLDRLDPTQARVIANVGPQLDLYLIPYRDRSGLWVGIHDPAEFASLGGGGSDAAEFNAHGMILGQSRQRSSTEYFTIYLLPDGVAVGDVGDAIIDPSQTVIYLEGLRLQEDFEISNGVLNLRR
jgi:hypothetical protein